MVDIILRQNASRPRGGVYWLAGYALAAGLSVLATGLNVVMRPVLEHSPTLLYTVVVVISAWRGGLGPGIVASVLSTLALGYFFVEPVQSLAIESLESLLHLAAFMFVAMLLGGAAAARRQVQYEEALLRERLEWRVRERTLDLENVMLQLRDLSAGLEAAREEERLRLAREVHDVLGGALTGMRLDVARLRQSMSLAVSGVPGAELTAQCDALVNEVEQMMQTVRRIASELRPSVLDDLGLLAAIEAELSEGSRRTGLEMRLNTRPAELEMDADAALGVFRVLQEALTNAARHAQATRVDVACEVQGDALRLVIRDNGRGFDVTKPAERRTLGLLGMRERLRLLGGHLVIHSQVGHGTRLDIHVPLHSQGQPGLAPSVRTPR